MSIEETKLPGVLPEIAEFTGLTAACGSFTVVTPLDGSSPAPDSILVVTPGDEPVGLPGCLEGVWEKNSGDEGPSQRAEDAGGQVAAGGISNLRGGEDPVLGFLKYVGSMAASSAGLS